MKKYKVECTQADGSIFTLKFQPMTFKDAQEVKSDYSLVFTQCKWRVVEVQ